MSLFERDKYKFSEYNSVGLVGSKVIDKRKSQANELINTLEEYNVLIKDLVALNPPNIIRNQLLNIAFYIIGDSDIFDYFESKKQLPTILLSKRITISKTYIERWQDYILLYTVILSNPKYSDIQDYLSIEEDIKLPNNDDKNEKVEENEALRGLILNVKRNVAIVITKKGEIKKIKISNQNSVGEEVDGKESKTFRHYKVQISIVVSLVLLLFTIGIYKYNKVATTMVIETTSSIKLEVNCFDMVISAYSPTDKGGEMLKTLTIRDKSIDYGLSEIFSYVKKEEMIPEGQAILITINGDALEYGSLHKTEEFIKANDIHVKFNNSGNEHTLN